MRCASAWSLAGCAALLALLAATGFGPCSNQDALRAAEARRDKLLASTRPKSEFWPEVERKGAAVKAEQKAASDLAAQKTQNEAVAKEVAAAEQSASDARSQRVAAETALASAKAELERAHGEVTKREETLAGFAARQRAGGPS